MKVIGLFLALVVGVKALFVFGTDDHIQFTVEEKDRVSTTTGETTTHKYMVWTDQGVFQNTDVAFLWKWNSAAVQGQMKVGRSYKAHVYGLRSGFFNMYPNIISVEEQ